MSKLRMNIENQEKNVEKREKCGKLRRNIDNN